MDIEKLVADLKEHAAEDAVFEVKKEGLQPSLYINPLFIKQVTAFLRDDPAYYMDFLSSISAVDYYPDGYFEVVYHLSSIIKGTQLCLKVKLEDLRGTDELPEVDSVSAIWRTAEWHERECFDLMGIFFRGHPDLRRILLPDDWEGFPLRKDYKDMEEYHGIAIK